MKSSDSEICLPETVLSVDGYKYFFGKAVSNEDIKNALEIDYMCYDDLYHLDWESCIAYHRKNPYIYIMASDDSGKIVGYVNFSPVTEAIYETMRSGKSVDTVITADDILEYSSGKEYSVYFSSICVHPDHRNKGISRMMLKCLKDLIGNLEKSDIHIKRVVADAVSEPGERLLSVLGFKMVCTSEHDSKIMERVFYDNRD